MRGALTAKSLPLELETWLQMIRTFWTLQSKVEDSLKKHKLTLAQFDLLAMLLGLEDLNQQELATKLAVTKGNMVGLVNRLSRRGFVKRVPSRKGRRANVIRLTASGRKLVTAALPDHVDKISPNLDETALRPGQIGLARLVDTLKPQQSVDPMLE